MSNVLMLSAIVMLVLLFFKVPVFIAVLGGSMVYFVMNPGINTVIFAQQAIIGTEKISLMAIPFFVCAGIFMNYTGVTKRIMDFCEVVTGRLPGGLAQVNVLLSTVMGGLSGSNIADAAMESKMMVPEMTKKGFSLESLRFHDDPRRSDLQETWLWSFNNRKINLVQILDCFKTGDPAAAPSDHHHRWYPYRYLYSYRGRSRSDPLRCIPWFYLP